MLKTVITVLIPCLIASSFLVSNPNLIEEYSHNVFRAIQNDDNEAPLAEIEGEPSATIYGCVNAISGQVSIMETDLTVYHGVTPLHLERSFAGPISIGSICYCWNRNHIGYLYLDSNYLDVPDWSIKGKLRESHGSTLSFQNNFYKSDIHPAAKTPVDFRCLKYGISNTAQGYISAQTNVKNAFLSPLYRVGAYITSGSGRKRYFKSLMYAEHSPNMLVYDALPSGNRFVYNYKFKKKRAYIKQVSLIDSKRNNRGYIEGPLASDGKIHSLEEIIRTHDKRSVTYSYYKINKKTKLISKVSRTDGPWESYNYTYYLYDKLCTVYMKKRMFPDDRYTAFEYLEEGHNNMRYGDMYIKNPSDPRIGKVKALYAPAGTDKTPVLIYEFHYEIQSEEHPFNPKQRILLNGHCDVSDALNHKVRYEYDEFKRLTAIRKFNDDGSIEGTDHLRWEDPDSKLVTCLRNRSLEVNGQTYFAREYEYDDSGNVLVDSLYGNLSGIETKAPLCGPAGWFKNRSTCECYKKHQEYSSDGLNLLLKECDGKRTTHYVYEEGSNRIAAKYTGSEDKIMRRWFYRYNSDAAVTYECTDDGSSIDFNDLTDVTERRITYFTQSETYPAAFPLIIEEKCLDLETGEEKLIHKVVNTYTNMAKISKQWHYDSENILRYTLEWDYDNMGNIKSETNALGETITRKYDANGNHVFESGPHPKFSKTYTYDFMNRLINETELHSDGSELTTKHRYDAASNKVATVDIYGNETKYFYDPFGRVIRILYPDVLDENGEISHPELKNEYDPLGKVSKETDAHGVEKRMTYTIRGQLVDSQFPDGTTEQNIYNLDGTLKQIKSRNNVVTKFEHDALGRPIKTEVFDAEGALLSVSTSVYSGFRLLEETDPMGVITKYTYYPDGKMKSKTKGDRCFIFEYDSLGRLIKTIDRCDEQTDDVIVKSLDYDLLDRVIFESTEDGRGAVLSKKECKFDFENSTFEQKIFCQTGECITVTTYDSRGTPVLVVDPLGHETITQIRYDYINALGQNVPYTEVTDSQGMVTIKIGDALGRVVETIKKNPFGKVIQHQLNRYDVVGNLRMIIDRLLIPDDEEKDCVTLLKYDSCRRLKACYEAVGTQEQKQTQFIYDKYGQKEKLVKNDGTIINYVYDALGRQKVVWSSDNTVNYEYDYDLNNHPLVVTDKINNTYTKRSYDINGYLYPRKFKSWQQELE